MSPLIIESLISESETIRIASGTKRVFVANGAFSDLARTIVLEEDAECSVYGFFTSGKHSIEIVHEWVRSRAYFGGALWSSDKVPVEVRISGVTNASETQTDLRILSLAGPDGSAMIDGSIVIEQGCVRSEWSLQERHIFLGSTGKIRGIPALLVRSDDVKAHHSLAIERISDEELFYLRSRGFSRDEATMVMLESSIIDVFASFGHRFPQECHSLAGEIMRHVRGAQ